MWATFANLVSAVGFSTETSGKLPPQNSRRPNKADCGQTRCVVSTKQHLNKLKGHFYLTKRFQMSGLEAVMSCWGFVFVVPVKKIETSLLKSIFIYNFKCQMGNTFADFIILPEM